MQVYFSGRTITVLGNHDLGNALWIVFTRVVLFPTFPSGIVIVIPVDENDYISILFNTAAVTQVRKLGSMLGSPFWGSAEL